MFRPSERDVDRPGQTSGTESYRTLIDNASDFVTVLDASGTILYDGTYLNIWTDDESLPALPREQLLGRKIPAVLGEKLVSRSWISFRRS